MAVLPDALSQFYSTNQISVRDFRCGNQSACDKAAADEGHTLWHGSEAFVGSRYGNPFSIVVVSLSEKTPGFELTNEQYEHGLCAEWI